MIGCVDPGRNVRCVVGVWRGEIPTVTLGGW